MNESLIIKILYKTVIGRTVLKVLVNPKLSRVSARFLSSPFSKWLVPVFVKKNQIDMNYYIIPSNGYKSFNDFFTRRMKEKYLWQNTGGLVAPCDGLLTVSEVNKDSVFAIKNTQYNLGELLNDKGLAEEFEGGTAFIFRLTPAHYHRYIWSITGCINMKKRIQGILHSVQPICHEKEKVFIQNSREYTVIDSPDLGRVVQMEIGALLVGKISNHESSTNQMICSGQEKGYFEYGGSSIVILIKQRVELAEQITDRYYFGNEIPVTIGEALAKKG